MTTTTTRSDERLEKVGRNALDSIKEMVAALECDYDRLEELRDERDGWEPDEDDEDAPETWAECHVEDAEELADLEAAVTLDDEEVTEDEARQRIEEDALSAQVRSDWENSADEFTPAEYCLLLTTGGPAVRIIGELEGGEVQSARLEVQDWGTPWTEHCTTGEDNDALMSYARCFYFGD
jgi:hypothetical protein